MLRTSMLAAAVAAALVLSASALAATSGAKGSARVDPKPHLNLEVILRPVDNLSDGGFGHVRFRQPSGDGKQVVYLDTWVRDLAPNSSYQLQRAVDTTVDESCTSVSWLTLGAGLMPLAIASDDRGTGTAALWRDLSALPLGASFDIHFRVIDARGAPVLESGCYQFEVGP